MLFNKNKTKENMTMDEENKMVELTDEQLKQVSGGLEEPKIIATFSCPGDCNGTNALTCQVSPCPHGRKHITFL